MKKTITAIAALFITVASVCAQSFQQSLFLDGYRMGYRYNPALQNESGFLSVGQWENQARNNVGASSFLYPRDGGVVTALHSSVSALEFMNSLQDDNYLCGNINFNLFSYGWRRDNAYNTLEANIRSVYSASIPREIFAIAKLGTSDINYDLSGMGLAGNAIVELAYGYSYKISDVFSIGARAKLLIGVESLNYKVSRFDMSFTEEAYKADVEANLDLTSRWRKIRPDEDGYLNLMDMSAKDRWKLPSGAGLSFDLGLTVKPFDGLTFSASVLDLGGMLWYYGNAGKSEGKTTFSGMKELSLEDIKGGKIMDQFKDVQDEFLHSIRIKSVASRTAIEAIPFNVNLGLKYEMPFYKALAIGATGNYVNMKGMSYWESRGVLSWNPWTWLGLTANTGTGSYGTVWGAAVNVAISRFHITAGYCDGFGGTVPYEGTPLKANNKMVTVGMTYDL